MRDWAMLEKPVREWPIGFLLAELRRRYAPSDIPPCRVCGGELSLQSIGGGEPTVWACSGQNEDGSWLPGRRIADDHYSRSRYVDRRQGGDEVVMELIRRRDETTAPEVDDG